MKVCALIPVYMADNCRDINLENLKKLKETEFKYVDEVVICDQCFKETDYIEGFTYLGPFQALPNKVADARNILFKWFYESDYDYAVLLDAREFLTKAGLNSFATLMEGIHSNLISFDFIQGTMGQIANSQRVADKCREDYKDKVYIRKVNSIQPQLHHTIISNFRKKYGIQLYVPAEKMGAASGVKDGVPDDIFFSKLCQTYFDTFLIGEMCVNTGKQSASTWATTMSDEGHSSDSDYYKRAEKIIAETYKPQWVHKGHQTSSIIDRVDDYIDLLGEYKPRSKAKKVVEDNNKYSLFD